MLDSSPVALPPVPRPLKRSASTASLPTPPRSYRKLARGKSRGSCDSDSDENAVSDKTGDESLGQRHKKRRIGVEKEVDEDAFWLGAPAVPILTPKAKSQPPLKANASVTTLSSTTSPPVTPETRSSSRRAIRDSPDNPFLATPENEEDNNYGDDSDSSANSSPHEPLPERPTITYVIRGVRRECKNPLYNHAEDRPLSPPPQSKLAIDHPDYSPSIRCIPKRLFADTISRRKREKKKKSSTATYKTRDFSHHPWKKARKRSPSLSNDDEDDDVVGEIRPLKLDFGSGKKKVDASGSSLDREDS